MVAFVPGFLKCDGQNYGNLEDVAGKTNLLTIIIYFYSI
jgi:hypothetical protein